MTRGVSRKATPQAHALYNALTKLGIEALLEYSDGHKHVDIFLPKSKICIEVDGQQHLTNPYQILTDLRRSHYSDVDGSGTLHIHNTEIELNLEKIAVAIAEASKIQEARLDGKHGWASLP